MLLKSYTLQILFSLYATVWYLMPYSHLECDAETGALCLAIRKISKICLGVQIEKAELDLLLFTNMRENTRHWFRE